MSKSSVAPPPALDASEAFSLLGISDWAGYKAIREGNFPVPVIRVGRCIRVPRRPLEQLLGIEHDDA